MASRSSLRFKAVIVATYLGISLKKDMRTTSVFLGNLFFFIFSYYCLRYEQITASGQFLLRPLLFLFVYAISFHSLAVDIFLLRREFLFLFCGSYLLFQLRPSLLIPLANSSPRHLLLFLCHFVPICYLPGSSVCVDNDRAHFSE